jgi:hypothetical protein
MASQGLSPPRVTGRSRGGGRHTSRAGDSNQLADIIQRLDNLSSRLEKVEGTMIEVHKTVELLRQSFPKTTTAPVATTLGAFHKKREC